MSMRYDLPGLFSLQEAPTAEFLRYWVTYRQVIEDFSLDYQAQMADLQEVTDRYWLMRGDERCGGLILRPNSLSHCFLIPPFADAHAMLSAVLPLLNRWSDRQTPTLAEKISPHFVAPLQRMGFKIVARHCWMIRPTAVLPYDIPDTYTLTPPQPSDETRLVHMLEAAFNSGPGKYGERTLQSYQAGIVNFLADYDPTALFGPASTLLIHPQTEQMVAVCLVSQHKTLPFIQLVAVHPDFQRQGLATNLINYAITQLAPHAGWVKLGLSAENPALNLYVRLGFIAATPLFTLRKNPGFRPVSVL